MRVATSPSEAERILQLQRRDWALRHPRRRERSGLRRRGTFDAARVRGERAGALRRG
jgi:hypothetical protein